MLVFKALLATIPVLALLLIAQPRADASQVACATVISAINQEVRKNLGKTPDISTIAKKLTTSTTWVEHCMRVYGRRPRRPGIESAEGREGRLEEFEDTEPEEQLPEDAGERELDVPERKPKQRILRLKRTPTPGGFREGY